MKTHKQDTDTQVFFYEQEFYPLSNFSSFELFWRNERFPTLEYAYHWEKFPHAPDIAEQILQARSAHDALKIATDFKSDRRFDWDEVKVGIMKLLMLEKFNQHEYVREKLRQTGSRELIEDSWRDDFWGWGENQDGKNVCGKLWMAIRAEKFGT